MATNNAIKPSWLNFIKTHDVAPEVMADYARYASMTADEILADFMDCHKDWDCPVYINHEETSYTNMLDVIALSDDESEYADCPFAVYAPIIKDSYRPFMVQCMITQPNTDLYMGMPELLYTPQKPEDGVECATCEIHIMMGPKDLHYTGYVYVDTASAAATQAQSNYRGQITDKAEALKFIEDRKSDDYLFCDDICSGGGYYASYPWLAQYLPMGKVCTCMSGYLDSDPVVLCIAESLRTDPDIKKALEDSGHYV